jgi:hypothetical protein
VHLLPDGKLPAQDSLIANKTLQEAHLSPLLDNSCCTVFQLVFVDGLLRVVTATHTLIDGNPWPSYHHTTTLSQATS